MAPLHHRMIIIGSGPAGYTAALYAARAMLSPVLFTGEQKGGQLTITQEIENFPGFSDPISATFLVEQMALQAQRAGACLVEDVITKANLNVRPFQLFARNKKQVYTCDALIIATGAKARWLGLPSEEKFKGRGVSTCATCDGFFYKGKDVLVIGGGNTAVEEALYLSQLARHVTLVHRRNQLRAEAILQERLLKRPNISILWDHEVIEILGTQESAALSPVVSGVRARHVKTGALQGIKAEGVFVAIGHDPASELFVESLRCTPQKYIWTKDNSTQTSKEGVFAAGDVADPIFKQAITAAATGCMAALEAEHFLSSTS